MSNTPVSVVIDDDIYLTPLDNLYIAIEQLDEKELDKMIKYIEDQKLLINVGDRRKNALRNELRTERIRIRKEINNELNKLDSKTKIQKKLTKKTIKSNDTDDESNEMSESSTIKPKKQINKKK